MLSTRQGYDIIFESSWSRHTCCLFEPACTISGISLHSLQGCDSWDDGDEENPDSLGNYNYYYCDDENL
jgi:hypothetical protein